MFGSTSSALLIWDPDNSLTDCLCGVISTHLMWVGITADGLWWSTEGSGPLKDSGRWMDSGQPVYSGQPIDVGQ